MSDMETEAPEDFSQDDARYEEMASRFEERDNDEQETQEEEAPQKEAERDPLPREELETRLNNTKAAMKEARREKRELEKRLEALEAKQSEQPSADELLSVIDQLRDDDEDPISDIEGVKRALKLFAQRQKAETEQENGLRKQQSEQQRLMSTVAEHEAEFREEHTDYDDAVKHLRASIVSDLQDQGLKGQALEKALADELIGMTRRAIELGQSPAEVAYKLATRRGFGQQKQVDKAEQKIQTLKKGQEAGRSLSSIGSKPSESNLTVASVAKMDGKELLEGYKKLRQQAKKTGTY